MAFEANVLLTRAKYTDNLSKAVMSCVSKILQGRYNIGIKEIVSREEYEKSTSSKEVNKYIRVKRKDLESEYELVKVGEGKYSSEHFASAKHAFVSVSQMENFVVVWFSFHSRLAKALSGFETILEEAARLLSRGNHQEWMAMRTTSLSRNKDLFVLHINGRERSVHAGKAALTDVKNVYGLDVNHVMDNVDQNIAIYYAPVDFAEVTRDLAEHKRRIEVFQKEAESLELKDKQDGSNMAEELNRENQAILKELEYRYELVQKAMKSPGIGTIIFFKLDEMSPNRDGLPVNEVAFGRPV